MKRTLFAALAVFGMLAGFSVSLDAQENVKIKDDGKKVEKVKEKAQNDQPLRAGSIEVSGYTRPGNPEDRYTPDGKLKEVSFSDPKMAKFKIMGGTVYFVVFKNTGLVEGDTFNTGLTNFDSRFETGRSFRDTMSPGIDRKAKYLYLYQVVNDRSLDARVTQVAGPVGKDGIVNPLFDPNAKKIPATEDIASFSLKLLVDPRYITSWGHFRDSAFAANVPDVDQTGKVVRNVVDDGKGNQGLAFSYSDAIVHNLTKTTYSTRSRAYSLGNLQNGLAVKNSSYNLANTATHKSLVNLVSGQKGKGDVKWVAFAENLINTAKSGKEPEFVQLMFMSPEERAALDQSGQLTNAGTIEDEITRAIFRVDFARNGALKQGQHSVVFGFTTDLPPVSAPVRIDTPNAAVVSEGLRLASYFGEGAGAGTGTGVGAGAGGGIVPAAGVAEGAALALATGSGMGMAVTPAGGGDPGTGGFAGIGGSFGAGLGGGQGGGGGGGVGIPSITGGFTRPTGVMGGGGGVGGGLGGGNGSSNGTPSQNQTQSNTPAIDFNATLVNLQAQLQAQGQFQLQGQKGGGGHGHGHGGHGGGHVVPAPASLLLGLLGLPGLYLLRRRKDEVAAEA